MGFICTFIIPFPHYPSLEFDHIHLVSPIRVCVRACVRARSGSLVTDFPHFPFCANLPSPSSLLFFSFFRAKIYIQLGCKRMALVVRLILNLEYWFLAKRGIFEILSNLYHIIRTFILDNFLYLALNGFFE